MDTIAPETEPRTVSMNDIDTLVMRRIEAKMPLNGMEQKIYAAFDGDPEGANLGKTYKLLGGDAFLFEAISKYTPRRRYGPTCDL